MKDWVQVILFLLIIGGLIFWAVSYSKRKGKKRSPFEEQKGHEINNQSLDTESKKDIPRERQGSTDTASDEVNNRTGGTGVRTSPTAAPAKKNSASSENKISIYRVLDILGVSRLADGASCFDGLCAGIARNMYLLPKNTELVIDKSYSIEALFAERIAWYFMLLNPSHPFINRLDYKNMQIVRTVQTMNSKDYVKHKCYDRDAVVEKLGCSVMIGNHITGYWRVLDMNYDPIANTIDLDHVFYHLRSTADEAAKLYDIYCACGAKAAQNIVQDYLISNYPRVRELYSCGTMDFEVNQVVLKLEFPRENTKQFWTEIPHIFFQSNARDPQRSAEQFYNCLMDHFSPHFGLSKAYLFEDGHNEYFCCSIGTARGIEKENELKFDFFEKYSQHDGGGSYSKTLELYKLSEEEWEKLEIPSKLHMAKEAIPCRGYWVKDHRPYYAEPFGIEHTYLIFSPYPRCD